MADMLLTYESVKEFGFDRLANELNGDKRKSSYVSKKKLAEKVRTASERGLNGLVALSTESKPCGFVLFKGNKDACIVTDAFTCQHFIGQSFFKLIFQYMKEHGFSKPTVEVDDNAKHMKQYIEDYGINLVEWK